MTITVELTDREAEVLDEIADRMGIPSERVLIQGLRILQLVEERHKLGPSLPKKMPMELTAYHEQL